MSNDDAAIDDVSQQITALLYQHAHGDYESSAKMLAKAIRDGRVPKVRVAGDEECLVIARKEIADLRALLIAEQAKPHWKDRTELEAIMIRERDLILELDSLRMDLHRVKTEMDDLKARLEMAERELEIYRSQPASVCSAHQIRDMECHMCNPAIRERDAAIRERDDLKARLEKSESDLKLAWETNAALNASATSTVPFLFAMANEDGLSYKCKVSASENELLREAEDMDVSIVALYTGPQTADLKSYWGRLEQIRDERDDLKARLEKMEAERDRWIRDCWDTLKAIGVRLGMEPPDENVEVLPPIWRGKMSEKVAELRAQRDAAIRERDEALERLRLLNTEGLDHAKAIVEQREDAYRRITRLVGLLKEARDITSDNMEFPGDYYHMLTKRIDAEIGEKP